jgi:hypothetical protein
MNKFDHRAQARAFVRASRDLFPPLLTNGRSMGHRIPPPLDKARARQACAPMGTLLSVVVTVDARRRRRVWYIVDPHPAVMHQYLSLGLEVTPGCRVLVDAEVMRPIAVLDVDPVGTDELPPSAGGFNPYFDLPPS